MPIITEDRLIYMLDGRMKKVLLLEPAYKRKYIPLGLAKISTYLKDRGVDVEYSRPPDIGSGYDLICITSLFTYNKDEVYDAIMRARMFNPDIPIILGGIFASLMSTKILMDFPFINIFKGYSKILDLCPPDYEIDYGVEEPWNDFSYIFTSRGCPNQCTYCAVWRLEKDKWINPNWPLHISDNKSGVIILDNNISACPDSHKYKVINEIAESGKYAIFEGIDVKHVDAKLAKALSKCKFTRRGIRVAFDRINEDGIFQNSVKMLLDAGISKNQIMGYVLFNLNDTPQEAYYRARECEKLGIKPYPQMYTPLSKISYKRNNVYVGKHWTIRLARAFRYYWLMAGFNSNEEFEEFIHVGKQCSTHNIFKFTFDDWSKWYEMPIGPELRKKVEYAKDGVDWDLALGRNRSENYFNKYNDIEENEENQQVLNL